MNVVEQIPAGVIGSLIDGEIVGPIPAPIGANGPVPFRNFKEEATRQPEAVMIAIEAFDAVAVGRAKVLEATMLERMVEVIALIVRPVVAVPVVVVDVRGAVHAAGVMMLRFRIVAWIVPLRTPWRNPPLHGARRIVPPAPTVLRENRECHE